jgi:preprotein translocase subunit SecB
MSGRQRYIWTFRCARAADRHCFVIVIASPAKPEPVSLEISIAGRFEQDLSAPNMGLDEFCRVNGPTLLMPFVRELVLNLTVRSRHGPVILPPINVVDLVHREEAPASS